MRRSVAGVVVLAATNRPQQLDAALLRPGRFDVQLYVPPPDRAGREQALRLHSRHLPLASDVDFAALADASDRFTGAASHWTLVQNTMLMFAMP